MKRICVFCGSSPGLNSDYRTMTEQLGKALLRKRIGLVYGGGDVGLMGRLAHVVVEGGGEVIGVIPKALAIKEIAYAGLPDLRVVESMHERKALMAELSDAFIALPGGLGTFEEFFEVLTWVQLGIHHKPCGILNISGYYDLLIEFLDHAVDQRFMRPEHRANVLVDDDPDGLLAKLASFKPQAVDKVAWVLEMKNS